MSNQNGINKAARAATAIANITKGAMAGGLYGAAAGAVKSFLPEIIKVAVIIAVVLLLLPTLVIAAIPNILFGFDNSKSVDIIELTGKAYSVDAAYKELEDYKLEAINKIIEDVKSAYTSEDTPEYDRVEVNTNSDNTNILWFIAINSVANQQDLFLINEDEIKSMAISKLTYTSSILETIEGEGEDMVTIKTLKININDIEPYELMEELNFTDEEKNWAEVLYSTLAG